MKSLFFTVVIAMTVMLSADSAQAGGSVELPNSSDYKVDPNYPAIIDGTNGKGYLIHAEQLMFCFAAFYGRYGREARSWQELCDVGYCQLPELKSPGGQSTDLDDGNLDFPWDVVYTFDPLVKKGGKRVWYGFDTRDEVKIIPFEFGERNTFARELEINRHYGAELGTSYWNDVGDEQLFFDRYAVYFIVQRSIWYFHDVHHRYPVSLQELFQSGLCPLGADPINPVTGNRLSASSGDTFAYADAGDHFTLNYLDENAQPLVMFGQPAPRVN